MYYLFRSIYSVLRKEALSKIGFCNLYKSQSLLTAGKLLQPDPGKQ
jgi:hypothetical protein